MLSRWQILPTFSILFLLTLPVESAIFYELQKVDVGNEPHFYSKGMEHTDLSTHHRRSTSFRRQLRSETFAGIRHDPALSFRHSRIYPSEADILQAARAHWQFPVALKSWEKGDGAPCFWEGVVCSLTGQVEELYLSGSNVSFTSSFLNPH